MYTPVLKEFNGAPVFEILRNGQPWNDELPFAGKKHFSFGVKKARSIIQAEALIRQYVSSIGAEPRLLDVADLWPNTGSGRYSSGADTKRVDNVRIWYQADLVTA